jgi:ArsR family metal-binding transcriptional regulator
MLYTLAKPKIVEYSKVNPWMTSIEFASYIVMRTFAPHSMIGKLNPPDGYFKMRGHFKNNTLSSIFETNRTTINWAPDDDEAKQADGKLRKIFEDIVYKRKILTDELNEEIEELKIRAYRPKMKKRVDIPN